jgi:UPF0755 protein
VSDGAEPGKARSRRRPKRRKRRPRGDTPAPRPVAPSPGPRRGQGARSVATVVVATGGLAALAAFATSVWLFVLYPSSRGPGPGHGVEVVVVRDPTPTGLAVALAGAGVVSSPRVFALWVRATGGTSAVVTGKHLLADDASPRELMARLERRASAGTAHVTFPEGWNRFDMARRLQDRQVVPLREFLDATTDVALLREIGLDGDSAEGFLFPATYDLPFDSDPRDIVRRMKREFDHRWDVLSRARGSSLNDVMISARLSIRDVVTLASMVEKEAVADDERPIIASVFLNRLRDPTFRPKHLECDPTAAYGCVVAPEQALTCADYAGKATAPIEHDPNNRYSTYTHEGLPPGPIANPGARSLEAAMSPATTHYYFFVARGEGRHAFSETYEAHLGALRGISKAP